MDTEPKPGKKTFEEEINRVLTDLGQIPVDSEEYAKAVKNLEVLCQARGQKTNRSVSTDTVIMAVTNILGIILVLNYEQVNVVSSKAIGFILRGRT